jgi:putative ABC transport system substrate-binding protein
MSYGADLDALGRRAATYAARILRGTRAGDLPVERPSVLELVINRRTARLLGITLPQSVLLRANRLIE